jgi:hypothetical protein
MEGSDGRSTSPGILSLFSINIYSRSTVILFYRIWRAIALHPSPLPKTRSAEDTDTFHLSCNPAIYLS